MNNKNENKSEMKQKMGFARRFAALLALCAVSAVYGNQTDLLELSETWTVKPSGEISGKDSKVLDRLQFAVSVAEDLNNIAKAETTDEKVTESCRLLLHLSSTALGNLIKKPEVGDLISKLGDHALDHPEDNGFAILVNWFYDHSSMPEKISEWWYDVRYGDAVLQDRYDMQIDYGQGYEFIPPDELAKYADDNQADPFDTMPESYRGCFEGNTSGDYYKGLKPLRLIN